MDEWVELTNGCLCCSVKDDFVNALESLMLQQTPFDYILIETTGLANPGPVASALWTDEELEAGTHQFRTPRQVRADGSAMLETAYVRSKALHMITINGIAR